MWGLLRSLLPLVSLTHGFVNCIQSTVTEQASLVNSLDGDLVALTHKQTKMLIYWSGTRLYKRTYDAKGTYTTSILAGKTESGGTPVDGIGLGAVFSDAQIGQSGIVHDGLGYVYVVDYGAVRRIDVETGAVLTVAGEFVVSAPLDGDSLTGRFAVDNAGGKAGGLVILNNNLYILEGDRIRILNTLGDVASLKDASGNVAFPFVHATDMAGNPANNALYVADAGAAVIYEIKLATDPNALAALSVTVFAGTKGKIEIKDGIGEQARFFKPTYLSYHDGYLFIGDSSESVRTIRRLEIKTGLVTTLFSNSKVRATSDGLVRFADGGQNQATLGVVAGSTFDEDGNMWFLDSSSKKIRKLSMKNDKCPNICEAPVCGNRPFNLCEDRGDGTRTCLCLDQNFKPTEDHQDCKEIALEPTPAPSPDLGPCTAILLAKISTSARHLGKAVSSRQISSIDSNRLRTLRTLLAFR